MYYLLNLIKFLVKKRITEKNAGKMRKNTGKVRKFCQSGKVGTMLKLSLNTQRAKLSPFDILAELF